MLRLQGAVCCQHFRRHDSPEWTTTRSTNRDLEALHRAGAHGHVGRRARERHLGRHALAPWPLASSTFLGRTWVFIRLAGWIVLLHLTEIAVWGGVLRADKVPCRTSQSALYFSAVTYTTTGYGDLVLPTESRLVGGVEAFTGILMCGWSTGFFIAVVGQMLQAEHREERAVTRSVERDSAQSPALAAGVRARGLRRAESGATAHAALFVLSVLAVVPLAALLSHATESVAARTGDTVGGLLNATLGNLTELVIALAALRAGEYTLVKASIAGAIVTNTLFMLGASFLLGGLRHHVQEYNRVSARLQASLLFLATIALLVPSAVKDADGEDAAEFTRRLSVGLAVLLIVAYGLGLLFSLKTHPELFASAGHGGDDGEPADRRCAVAARRRDGAGGARQRGVRRVRARGREVARHDAGVRRLHRRRARGRGG